MTKEITKAIILQEIQDKLKLRELEPETFRFEEAVVPVYNIEQHLITRKCEFVEMSITATGDYLFFNVPINQRWTFDRYDVVFMGAGAFTVAGAFLRRRLIAETVYLDLTAAQTVSYHVGLPVRTILDPGDQIRVNVDGYTSTQNLRLYLDYEVEELR